MLQQIKKIFEKKQKNKLVAKLYDKCNLLPIHNFNEISNNNNFEYLKINQNDVVSEIELQECWLGILDEFYKLSKNTSAKNQFQMQIDLMLLQRKLNVFETIYQCLENDIDVLKECKIYKIIPEQIRQHIGVVKNRIGLIYENMPKSNNAKFENQFEKTIAIILKNGFQINRHTTVVSEWCAILNLIEEQNKANKQQHEQY